MDRTNEIIISSYLEATLNDLEMSIGRIIGDPEKDLVPAALDDLTAIRKCKEFLEERREVFYQKICIEWEYKIKITDSKFQDNINLVATIADTISGCCGLVPPFIVATLLFKKGINKLCEGGVI